MGLLVAKIQKRTGTINNQYSRNLPRSLHAQWGGKKIVVPWLDGLRTVTLAVPTIRFSLETANAVEAKTRKRDLDDFFDGFFAWAGSEGTPIELTHKQVMALAGDFYKAWSRGPGIPYVARVERKGSEMVEVSSDPLLDDPELADEWAAMEADASRLAVDKLRATKSPEELAKEFRSVVNNLLIKHSFPQITEDSAQRVVGRMLTLLPAALQQSSRVAMGDYSHDSVAAGFPELALEPHQQPQQAVDPAKGVDTITGIVEAWWHNEAKRLGVTQSTYEGYAATFKRLSDFLGHNDLKAITPQDMIRYKDWRLQQVSPKTVKAGDMAAIKSIFKWAVGDFYMTTNPAEKVVVKLGKKVKTRERDFTKEEVSALLKAASGVDTSGGNLTKMAQHWVPFLCAYSGARVGEIVQLRKEDIRKDPELGIWVMRVTPEAGTVKTKEYRDVPLHPHLVELGFPAFVQASRGEYLFMEVKAGSTFRGVWRSKKNRLSEFAREHVTDPNVAPNHGWRHTFKTRGFEAGIQEKVLDAICGHAPRSTGQAYGSVSLKTKADAMQAFPRYTY